MTEQKQMTLAGMIKVTEDVIDKGLFNNRYFVPKKEWLMTTTSGHRIFNYLGCMEVVRSVKKSDKSRGIRITPQQIEKTPMQDVIADMRREERTDKIVVCPEAIDEFERRLKEGGTTKWRIMTDDMVETQNGREYEVTHVGEMLTTDFDEKPEASGYELAEGCSIPMDSLGRCYGCPNIQHMVDGKWTWVIG